MSFFKRITGLFSSSAPESVASAVQSVSASGGSGSSTGGVEDEGLFCPFILEIVGGGEEGIQVLCVDGKRDFWFLLLTFTLFRTRGSTIPECECQWSSGYTRRSGNGCEF